MLRKFIHWQTLMLGALTLILAGCFQQVGDEVQPTLVSQALPTNTWTPSPTATETLKPTVEVTDIATATPEATTNLDQLIADSATSTPQSIAQDATQPVDPFVLTATVLVQEITQTVEAGITQTASALGIGATLTPTFTPTPPEFVASPTIPTNTTTTIGGTCVHEVLAGENLFRLSLRYGVSVNDLARASGITNAQLIVIGQRVTIPGCGTTGVLPPPTSIPIPTSTPFGATDTTFNAQGVTGTTTGTTTTTTTLGGRTHLVQQYETLFEISLLYGVPVQSIANANGIININNITMGTELVIPSQ